MRKLILLFILLPFLAIAQEPTFDSGQEIDNTDRVLFSQEDIDLMSSTIGLWILTMDEETFKVYQALWKWEYYAMKYPCDKNCRKKEKRYWRKYKRQLKKYLK